MTPVATHLPPEGSNASADGFAELANALWPIEATPSDPSAYPLRLRGVLAELLRRAGAGIGSWPLAETGLSPNEQAALER